MVQYNAVVLPLTNPIMNAETAPGIGPLNVVINMADDAARSALHTAFVREKYPAVGKWAVTRCGAAIDTLLTLALETDIVVDYSYVGPRRIDIVRIEAEFSLNRGRI